MKEQLFLWEIKKIHWNKGQGTPVDDFVVAPNLESVLTYLEKDREDLQTEVNTINKILVISSIL